MSSEWLIEGRLKDGRIIQVTNTGSVLAKNRAFENRRLTRGWRLNTGPLATGSTVPKKALLTQSFVQTGGKGTISRQRI